MAENDTGPELGSVFEFKDDVSQTEAPPPLPQRSYTATITGAVAKQGQKGRYADVEFTISPDQFPPDFAAIQADAVKLHYRFVPLDDTQQKRYQLRKFCEAIRAPVSRRVDLNDFIGKSASVKVGESEYLGEKRAEIKSVESL